MTRWLGINEGVRDKCPWHLMRLQERRTLDLASLAEAEASRQGKERQGKVVRQGKSLTPPRAAAPPATRSPRLPPCRYVHCARVG